MDQRDIELKGIASQQHALVSTRQAHSLGLNADAIAHRVAAGALEALTPRVLRVRGAQPTAHQALMTLVLDAGRSSALSHTTALAHWGVRGFVLDPSHICRRRDVDDHAVRGAVLHEVRYLPQSEIRVLEGIPVVSPALALLQLAGMRTSLLRIGLAIDAALSDRLVSHRTLCAVDQLMSRQGRRGLTAFRALISERGAGYVPPGSNLEGRFVQILEKAGRRPMERQVHTSDDDGWIGRVDFRDTDLPVVAEVQSERFHRGLLPEARDAERISALRRAGFEVIEVTEEDIFFRQALVVEAVDRARACATARLAA